MIWFVRVSVGSGNVVGPVTPVLTPVEGGGSLVGSHERVPKVAVFAAAVTSAVTSAVAAHAGSTATVGTAA